MFTYVRIAGRDRKQQILDIASRLFARKGFQGTTTREIAARARVNEALLFRHFPSKDDLYWAVIEERCMRSRRRENLAATLDLQASDYEIFRAIAEDLLRRNQSDKDRTRLLLYSGLENHRLAHRFFRTYVQEYYRVLAAHIERRIKQGVFRKVDPLLAARGFMGMILYHNLVQEIFGGGMYQSFDPEEVSAALADIWLQGVLLPSKASRNGKNGHNGKSGRTSKNRNGGRQ